MTNAWTCRPVTDADAAKVTRLINTYNQHFRGEDVFTEEEFASLMTSPSSDPQRDGRLLSSADGTVVGAVFVSASDPWSAAQVHLAVVPEPHRAEVIGRLLEEASTIALSRSELSAEADFDVEGVLHEDDRFRAVLQSRGFSCVREVTEMQRGLDDLDGNPPDWPLGVAVSPLRTDDLSQLRQAAEVSREAFHDHDGDHVMPVADFVHMVQSMPTARPALSLLAVDAAGPVGLALNFARADDETCGYVGVLGVVRRARGQGLATALLLESFRRFSEVGWRRAKLHVQVGNRTGADRLYRSVGMSSGAVEEVWSVPLSSL